MEAPKQAEKPKEKAVEQKPEPAKSDATKEKEAERAKLDLLLVQIDKLVTDGNAQLKKSMYEEAVAIFTRAADLVSHKKPEYAHLKKVLIEKEAAIFSSIAACYKQTQSSKKEIEFCSKVIERAPYISDTAILARAY